MKTTVNASMEEVEKAFLRLAPQVFYENLPTGARITAIKDGKDFDGLIGVEIKKFGDFNFWIINKNLVRGKNKDLTWGIATINPKGKHTDISIQLFSGDRDIPYQEARRYENRIELLLEKLLQEYKTKRESTLEKEREVIKVFRAMEKRNQKEFREALHSEDVKQNKVTGQDVFDKIGAKVGLKKRSIEKIIKAYRESLK